MAKAIEKISKGTEVKRFIEDHFKVFVTARTEKTVNKGTFSALKPKTGKFSAQFQEIAKKYTSSASASSIRMSIEDWKKVLLHLFENKGSVSLLETDKKEGGDTNVVTKPEPKSKPAKGNKAWELLKQIEAIIKSKGDSYQQILRENYTEEEIKLLAQYPGKGGLIKEGATGTEVLNSFYTPDLIVRKMWGLARKYGVKDDAKVLEPAVGIGAFLKYHNPALFTCYETAEMAYTICKVLYPLAAVHNKSFETAFFYHGVHRPEMARPKYDLVIMNPPYEEYKSPYSKRGEKQATGATRFEHYFLTRSLDLTVSGGLVVCIIPSGFMRNDQSYNTIKENINAKAELLDAYRLPNDAFHNTYVGTDILVFRKR